MRFLETMSFEFVGVALNYENRVDSTVHRVALDVFLYPAKCGARPGPRRLHASSVQMLTERTFGMRGGHQTSEAIAAPLGSHIQLHLNAPPTRTFASCRTSTASRFVSPTLHVLLRHPGDRAMSRSRLMIVG